MTARITVSPSISLGIRYHRSVGYQGPRYIVSDRHTRRRVVVHYQYELNEDDRLRDALERWLTKHGESMKNADWTIASLSPGNWVAVSSMEDQES